MLLTAFKWHGTSEKEWKCNGAETSARHMTAKVTGCKEEEGDRVERGQIDREFIRGVDPAGKKPLSEM